jgi:hypothetical protein
MNIAGTLSATIGNQSDTTLVVSGIFALLLAVFGYRLSQRIRATRGVTPWRIPSAVWALICFFFAPFGFALELIAIVSTRNEANKLVASNSAPTSFAPPIEAPKTTEEALSVYVPKIPASGYGGPKSDVMGKPALFGWYPDVTSRHELRYWDGRDWTKFVSDADVYTEDPLH